MFLNLSPKTALKSTQNSSLYSILKLTFPEIFKNESFFSQFYFKKISILFTVGFLTCFSANRQKPHSKISKAHFFAAFWNWRSRKFLKMKVFVFLNFLKIFFRLMQEFLRLPHNYFKIFFRLMQEFLRLPHNYFKIFFLFPQNSLPEISLKFLKYKGCPERSDTTHRTREWRALSEFFQSGCVQCFKTKR